MISSEIAVADQVVESGPRRRAQIPQIRHVMQTYLASSNHSAENRRVAREHVLNWAREKWFDLIPQSAYDGTAFEHDQAGLRIAATGNSEETVWAFRSEHLDAQEARTWVTEVVIKDVGSSDFFGIRNSCSTPRDEPVPLTSPRFMRELVASAALVDDAFPVTGFVRNVSDEPNFQAFKRLLLSQDRVLPIIVVTVAPKSGLMAVNPSELAQITRGLAHVFIVDPTAALLLSAEVGKALSVFNGAVRTYLPRFGVDSDPREHRLCFPVTIDGWRDEGLVGPRAFLNFLARQMHRFSVDSPAKIDQLPSYFTIRSALLKGTLNKLEAGQGEPAAKQDVPSENIDLQVLQLDLEEARARERNWEQQSIESDEEARAFEQELFGLRAQNQILVHDLKALRSARGRAEDPIPESYSEVVPWMDSHFADRLFLHPRAVRELKGAIFEDVKLVCRSLQLVADAYWPMCANDDPDRRRVLSEAWERGLGELGLDYDHQSVSPTRLGEFRSEYTIAYRIGQTSKQVLGPHLKFGNGKDDRYCMRIYFLWDDVQQKVVIGSLPAHLDTRAT